jgi:hypothetical protein
VEILRNRGVYLLKHAQSEARKDLANINILSLLFWTMKASVSEEHEVAELYPGLGMHPRIFFVHQIIREEQ